MKKENVIFPGLLVLATVIVLTSCASLPEASASKWDSSVEEDQLVTLVYCEEVRINAIDGVEKQNGVYQGKGSVKKPQKILAIPAGERTLSVALSPGGSDGPWTEYKETKYNFLPEHTYQLNVKIDQAEVDRLNREKFQAEGFGAALGQAFTQGMTMDYPLLFEIIDITK